MVQLGMALTVLAAITVPSAHTAVQDNASTSPSFVCLAINGTVVGVWLWV